MSIKITTFKENFTLEKRREIYQRESKAYPNRVAVVVECHPNSKVFKNKAIKFMAQKDMGILKLKETIKKHMHNLNKNFKNEAQSVIFLFCKQQLVTSQSLSDLIKNRDPQDGFLYLLMAETDAF